MYKTWLLKLILPYPYGRLLTGLLVLAALLPFFYLGAAEDRQDGTPALFFSAIIAYIIPVFSFITAKSEEALAELRPVLDIDQTAFDQARVRLSCASLRNILLPIVAGLLMGFTHLSFVHGSVQAQLHELTELEGFVSSVGALLVWVTMTSVISMLIQQAMVFARLGANNVTFSLLNTRKLLPFARVSIISSLAIIGALALFPLLSFESGLNLAESLPGAIATLIPLIALFIIPVWPIHRRLVTAKERALRALNERLDERLDNPVYGVPDAGKLNEIAPLLVYKREIADVSTWPFDAGVVTRLTLYLIIPPLTWAGAALIENLVDSVL